MYTRIFLKLLNFTIRLHLPYNQSNIIDYDRREARDKTRMQLKEKSNKICSSSPRIHSYSMSIHVHCLTEYLFRTHFLPNTRLYTRSALSFKEDLHRRWRRRRKRVKERVYCAIPCVFFFVEQQYRYRTYVYSV